MDRPRALLINPWIYDFAAFDLWARPLGLLFLAELLERAGVETRLVDALDRLHPRSGAPPRRKAWPPGTGQWLRTPVQTPEVFKDIPRRYSRYGLPEEVFAEEIGRGPRPDVVLVTSSMTYWRLGAARAVELIRSRLPGVPVILGGTYATLCEEQARKTSGADLVASGPGEAALPLILKEFMGMDPPGPRPVVGQAGLRPRLELYPRLDSAPLLTSRGCPLRCPYCASGRLFDGFIRRPPEDVLDEIEDRRFRLGIRDFAFFDDALLVGAEKSLIPVFEEVVRKGWDVRFHAPNGLHVGLIEPDLARLMAAAGLKTVRLGLESLDPERSAALGDKTGPRAFEAAVKALRGAGFQTEQIGVYILYGLPGQPLEEVLPTARLVRRAGARPYLAEYSPVPGTRLWPEAVKASPFPLQEEPLCHNNSLVPCRGADFSWEKFWEIKRQALCV